MKNLLIKKLLVLACILPLSSFSQTFTDIDTYDDDLDWADERNIYDDYAPYEEDYEYAPEQIPQQQVEPTELTDPVEYSDEYYDDVDLIEEEYDSDYYDTQYEYDYYGEDTLEDTSL
ncbi:MAG: hypothetical protein KC478_07310 [Bacteriovoracaceae bacterium]|nr:hypothetical protein [Bacteriovoracaceae bacterium]